MPPEEALNEANSRIQLAHKKGEERLDLNDLNLSQIPGEIITLAGTLRELVLHGDFVDLSALSTLRALQYLNLIGCGQISDLRPLF